MLVGLALVVMAAHHGFAGRRGLDVQASRLWSAVDSRALAAWLARDDRHGGAARRRHDVRDVILRRRS